MLKQYRLKDYKFRLVFMVIALSVIGILVVGSADASYQSRQAMGFAGGMVVMIIASLVDYNWLLNFYWLEYILGIVLLLAVRFFGSEAGGATRWIDIGFLRFQPSDVEKIILILFYAKIFTKYEEKLNSFPRILFFLATVLVPWYLIFDQPNLSTSIVVLLLFCAMIFIGGLSYKIIGGIIAVGVPLVIIFFSIILQPDQTLLHGYQVDRILGWLYPEEYPDISNQQTNSIIAIGSGQLYGKGLNNNEVASVNNGNFIPEPQTDFIFAVLGEHAI